MIHQLTCLWLPEWFYIPNPAHISRPPSLHLDGQILNRSSFQQTSVSPFRQKAIALSSPGL